MKPELHSCELLSTREVIPGTLHLVLRAPRLAGLSRPGQFVMVQAYSGTDPLLRRPISLCGAGSDTVELLFQLKGRGTRLMAAWHPGVSVSLLGPLGSGFTLPDTLRTAVLVGGGIGAAPLLFLANKLLEVPHISRQFYFGAKTGGERVLVEDFLVRGSFSYFFASEDGSAAFQGFVTCALARDLEQQKFDTSAATVFSCGPEPMLKKVAQLAAQFGMASQVSLEASMACGVGACLGCVAAATDGYKRVCAEGPVFDSKDILWSHD